MNKKLEKSIENIIKVKLVIRSKASIIRRKEQGVQTDGAERNPAAQCNKTKLDRPRKRKKNKSARVRALLFFNQHEESEMKTKTLRLAVIDAINYGNDDWLLFAIKSAANIDKYIYIGDELKRHNPIKHLRMELARIIREQRRNERYARKIKKEEEAEWKEMVETERRMYREWGMPR